MIVKQKPAGLAIEQLFAELRRHVQPGARAHELDNHVDGLQFWQHRFSQSEQENTRLRAQLAMLEREVVGSKGSGSDPHAKKRRKAYTRPTVLDAAIESKLASVSNLTGDPGQLQSSPG